MRTTSQSATERYLRRATWGLWGKQRRGAQAELRGIIEDKLWRFKLLGLSDQEAEARALAELGHAGALAAGLSRVHSLPLALQGALLAGVLGALGVQMVGAAAGVRAVPYQSKTVLCSVNDHAEGCGKIDKKLNYYLPADELVSTLRQIGLDPQKLNLVNHSSDVFDGKNYYSMFGFVSSLLNVKDLALHLKGEQNPTLTIGKTNVMIGTPSAPVLADSLILPAVWQQLRNQFQSEVTNPDLVAFPALVAFIEVFQYRAKSMQQLSSLPNGRYALITSIDDPAPGCACGFQLRLKTTNNGFLPLINAKTSFRLVDTPEALADAKATGIPAVLVYRVGEVNDLRQIPLTPVKISGLKVVRK